MVEEITNIDPPGMHYYNVVGLPSSSLSLQSWGFDGSITHTHTSISVQFFHAFMKITLSLFEISLKFDFFLWVSVWILN